MKQKQPPAHEIREYHRAHALFAVTLIAAMLLLMWALCVFLGDGIGYHSPAHVGFSWNAHDLWQFIKALVLFRIGSGVALAGVDGIDLYQEVALLRSSNGELRQQITELTCRRT